MDVIHQDKLLKDIQKVKPFITVSSKLFGLHFAQCTT